MCGCSEDWQIKKYIYLWLKFLWCSPAGFTDLPEFHPQCSALLRAQWSILSKNFNTLFQILLWHTAELRGCPGWRKRPSDVCTAWNWHCSKRQQCIQIKTDREKLFTVHTDSLRHAATALKLNRKIYQTFCPPAPCFNDPSNETLSLLSLTIMIHTMSHTHFTHLTVLPVTLTHQDLLHRFFIQYRLHRAHTFCISLLVMKCPSLGAKKWITCMCWCFWVLTSGMELICLVERENTSLPKCSTSPTCHLDGSLANKYTYLLITAVLFNPCLQAQCWDQLVRHFIRN